MRAKDRATNTDLQRQFTRHIRDPDHAPAPPDIEERRIALYRDLIYRGVEGFLANSFPVLRKILTDEEWHPLMRDYLKRHRARTPLFPKMPQEFLRYLQDEREEAELPYPFIRELAHYEWVETALTIDSRALRLEGVDADGDLLAAPPVLSELIWPLACAYPVHSHRPRLFARRAAGATHLSVGLPGPARCGGLHGVKPRRCPPDGLSEEQSGQNRPGRPDGHRRGTRPS